MNVRSNWQQWSDKHVFLTAFNPIQDGHFAVCYRMGGSKRSPFLKSVSHISYNDETWHNYTLPKDNPKNTKVK